MLLGILLGLGVAYLFVLFRSKLERWKLGMEEALRRETLEKSRDILKGKIGEQMVPLPRFRCEPSDARFIGSPVDYVIFEGYSKGEPEEVVFPEVKTGSSTLPLVERKIKEMVEGGKVRWETYRAEARGLGPRPQSQDPAGLVGRGHLPLQLPR